MSRADTEAAQALMAVASSSSGVLSEPTSSTWNDKTPAIGGHRIDAIVKASSRSESQLASLSSPGTLRTSREVMDLGARSASGDLSNPMQALLDEVSQSSVDLSDEKTREVNFMGLNAPDPVLGLDVGGSALHIGFIRQGSLHWIQPEPRVFWPALIAAKSDGSLEAGFGAVAIAEATPEFATRPRDLLRWVDNPSASEEPRLSVVDGRFYIKLGHFSFDLADLLFTFFQSLRTHIQEALGKSQFQLAISVPDHYGEVAYSMLKKALSEARINLVGLTPESEAALGAYKLTQKRTPSALIIDVGATHAAFHLLERQEDQGLQLTASKWHTDLSAAAIDAEILLMIRQEIGRELSPAEEQSLKAQVTAARTQTKNTPSFDFKVGETELRIMRERLYQASELPVGRILQAVEAMLSQANLELRDLSHIVMAGSGGSFPPLQHVLANQTQREILSSIPPVQLYVHGLAAGGQRLKSESEAVASDTLVASVGIRIPGGRFFPLVAAGTRLPTKLERTLPTQRDKQASIELAFYQGEAERVRNCQELGVLSLRGLPKPKRGSDEVPVKLSLTLAKDGVMTVELVEEQSGIMNGLRLGTQQTPESRKKQLVHEQPESRDITPPKTKGFFSRWFGN